MFKDLLDLFKIAALLCLMTLLIVGVWAVQEVRHEILQITLVTQHINSQLSDIDATAKAHKAQIDGIMRNSWAASQRLEGIVQNADKVEISQMKYWENYGPKTQKILDDVDASIVHLDNSINNNLIPAATQSLVNTQQVETQLAGSITDLSTGLKPMLANASTAMLTVSDILADPTIKDTLHNINTSSANAIRITAGAGVMASNGAAISTDLKDAVHRSTRPATFSYKIGVLVIEKAGSLFAFLRTLTGL